MSNERHETVADNVSVNHQFREVAKMIPHEEVNVSKMETTTPTREKSSAVGNAAAMHKALEKFNAVDLSGLEFPLDGDSSTIYNSNKKEITIPYWRVAELLNEVKAAQDMANSALSAPPRNCDVGTADEQAKMFHSFCEKFQSCIQEMCSPLCPFINCCDVCHCMTKWLQMPYKEGEK